MPLPLQFLSKHLSRASTAKEEGLKGAVGQLVGGLARRYEDVAEKDQITRVQQGVDQVKQVMQININAALENLAHTESILQKSGESARPACD
jgi:hypothetical protein